MGALRKLVGAGLLLILRLGEPCGNQQKRSNQCDCSGAHLISPQGYRTKNLPDVGWFEP